MRRARVHGVALTLIASLGAIASARGQTTVTASDQRRSIECGGQTVQVTGSRNTLTVTGDCRKVDVAGSGNTVSIEAVERIEVTGTNNHVTWQRALGRETPRISRTGLGNTVSRDANAAAAPAAPSASAEPRKTPSTPSTPAPKSDPAPAARESAPPPPPPPPAAPKAPAADDAARSAPATPTTTGAMVKLLEDGRSDTVDCRGRDVSILGSRNSLRLRGTCPMVIVSGSDNIIDIDTAERIKATGDRNRLTWTRLTTGKQPKVENTGTDNRVSKADM